MILETRMYNNGYGCSCCRNDWENKKWIEESEMESFESIVNCILNGTYYNEDENDYNSGLIYEKDGEILYGYRIKIYKATDESFILIGDNEYKVTSGTNKLMTAEEINKLNEEANFPGQFMDWKKEIEEA
jgi:hypothetical protein